MEVKERHFPYPIIAKWSDDIQYQAESSLVPTINKEKDSYVLAYRVAINNPTIMNLIRSNKATLVMHIECTNSLYRKLFPLPLNGSDIFEGEVIISADEIYGKADATIMVIATDTISNYTPEGIHADYDGVACELQKGDYIAAIETYKIPLRQEYDLLKKISTIIVFNRDDKRKKGPIQVDFYDDKLVAKLPIKLHDTYQELKDYKNCTAILTSMLVVPVLMEGLSHIKELWSERGSRSERWFNLLCQKLDDMKCDMGNASPIEVAQEILDLPYERSSTELKLMLGQEI